jgi:hypothetical protein
VVGSQVGRGGPTQILIAAHILYSPEMISIFRFFFHFGLVGDKMVEAASRQGGVLAHLRIALVLLKAARLEALLTSGITLKTLKAAVRGEWLGELSAHFCS